MPSPDRHAPALAAGVALGVLSDEPGQDGRRAHLPNDLEVLAERSPGNRSVIAVQRESIGQMLSGKLGKRGEALAAVADDFGCDTLSNSAFGGWIGEQRPIRVAVGIDEAGAHDLP